MKNKIVTLVMSNGAEIIGKYIADDFNSIIIYKPRMVQATQQGVGLVNGISMTGKEPDGNFTFPRTSVMYMIETMKELADGWTTQTSGIAIPTGGLVK
tara:strand:+ start:2568 stop:2861 length:294 start_codon:yes stop_codon:yes gene_type:complete